MAPAGGAEGTDETDPCKAYNTGSDCDPTSERRVATNRARRHRIGGICAVTVLLLAGIVVLHPGGRDAGNVKRIKGERAPQIQVKTAVQRTVREGLGSAVAPTPAHKAADLDHMNDKKTLEKEESKRTLDHETIESSAAGSSEVHLANGGSHPEKGHPQAHQAAEVKEASANTSSNRGIDMGTVQNVLGFIAMPYPKRFEIARALATTHQELQEPEVLRPPLTLKMQATKLPVPWIGGHFWTRGYGTIPGPTIRVRPGETLDIQLENGLADGPGYDSCNFDHADLGFFMNPQTICALNHTNLHTHGLHVSAEQPGDDIFAHVLPGATKAVSIKVPENHMGGTHWYHPHLHHATAAQAGGGAHGAIIVDDPIGALPRYVEEMPERMLFLSLVNVAKSMRLEAWGLATLENGTMAEQKLWLNPEYPLWRWDPVFGTLAEQGDAIGTGTGGVDPQVVVNGQWRPKMTLDEGKWHRLRFVFASIEQRVEVFPTHRGLRNTAFCQYQLLAKDGIYLHEAPRQVGRIYLVSGSRADVAVSCTCGWKRPCQAHLNFTTKWEPMGMGPLAMTMASTTGELLRIDTGFGFDPWRWWNHPASAPLQKFSVRRPCYLADLRQAHVNIGNRHEVDLPQIYPMKVNFDGRGRVWGHETPKPMADIPVGEIQEWRLSGIRFHPFHLHVNPFQVVRIWSDPYYMPGDWHDTMLPTGSGVATVRVNVDRFIGKMIAHCHLLEHEDNGMMGFLNITGVEGTVWPEAHVSDAQCYDGHYPGPPLPVAPPAFR